MPITCSKNYRKGSLYTLTAKSVVASGVLLGLPLRLHMLHARYTVVHSVFFDSVSSPVSPLSTNHNNSHRPCPCSDESLSTLAILNMASKDLIACS